MRPDIDRSPFQFDCLANNLIVDTHFYQRDRMGRLAVFVARVMNMTRDQTAHGIGVSEHTALLIETSSCRGVALGVGPIDAIRLDASIAPPPSLDTRLTAGPYNATNIAIASQFDLRTWQLRSSSAGHRFELYAVDGELKSRDNNGKLY
jgi:cyanophycinase